MAKNIKRIAWLTIFVIFVAFIVYSLVNSYWERNFYTKYKINDEIKDFPITGVSVTFTNYSFMPDVYDPTSEYLYVNETVRNLTNQTLDFNTLAFQQTFRKQTEDKYLSLDCYANDLPYGGTGNGDYRTWWGITISGIPINELESLQPNESVNGSIRYMLRTTDYSSFDLRYASTSKDPIFTVNLTQG